MNMRIVTWPNQEKTNPPCPFKKGGFKTSRPKSPFAKGGFRQAGPVGFLQVTEFSAPPPVGGGWGRGNEATR